jgi:RNA polymerase sigma-70 factor (ECF subfamily)
VTETNEETTLKLASQGNQEAFGDLYQKYVGKIYNYIYYRTGSVDDAEDLTARVFFRALQHMPNYRDRGLPFSAWLYRIAHNLVANWHRDSSRRKETAFEESMVMSKSSEHPERELVKQQENEELFQLLQVLPVERQQLIILKFVEQLPNSEIGKIMGRTEGAVKSLYHRTLLSLRDEYKIDEKFENFLSDD